MLRRMQRLDNLLDLPNESQKRYYEYLPVSTSYNDQLKKQGEELLALRFLNKKNNNNQQFQANQSLENIKNDLILLKLKGYIDPRDITSKSTEIKKLPSKVQVGTVIEGDPIQASKIRNKKRNNEFIDYFLSKDDDASFTNRKFNEIQKVKQRKKKIKKRILQKKQKASAAGKRK